MLLENSLADYSMFRAAGLLALLGTLQPNMCAPSFGQHSCIACNCHVIHVACALARVLLHQGPMMTYDPKPAVL